jgi:hypothetical protein
MVLALAELEPVRTLSRLVFFHHTLLLDTSQIRIVHTTVRHRI